MVGVAKRLRPRIVVPTCVGSNPITHPIKNNTIHSDGVIFYLWCMGFEK